MTRPDTNILGDAISEEEIVSELKAEVKAFGTAYAWAKAHGVDNQMVYDIVNGKKEMRPYVAEKLGYYPVRMWAKS